VLSAAEAGRRRTRQRSMIAALLGESAGFRTAQDLHQALRARGEHTGLATVYRALHALAGAGEVDVVRTARGEMLYRRCGSGHHHHLICRRCGRAVEVTSPGLQRWITRIAAEHGYRGIEHIVEITGICPVCARATVTAGAAPERRTGSSAAGEETARGVRDGSLP
jgi:Fur family ferric uptake transcriptional regulator